jgi:hypothetical protein
MRFDEFWDSTWEELMLRFEAYTATKNREAEENSLTLYATARMTAEFVNLVLNGKRIPSYDSLNHGRVSSSTPTPGQKVNKELEASKVSAYLLEYARRHNEQRHRRLESAGEVK